eukprot:CFRG8431T1
MFGLSRFTFPSVPLLSYTARSVVAYSGTSSAKKSRTFVTMNSSPANFVNFGRKIVCVGRNYVEHAKELDNPIPNSPMIFLKPPSSYLPHSTGNPILLPPGNTIHHEVELGVVIGDKGTNIPVNEAMNYVAGYCLALDLTARDIQEQARNKGHPWTVAKGYDTFTPVSEFIPKGDIADPQNVRIWCEVDEKKTQDGNTKDMIFNIETLINFISSIMTLEKGDVILTGTPAGVGPILPGQSVRCGLGDSIVIDFKAINRLY